MGVLEDCLKLFGEKDLYKVLEVEKTAAESAIKRAYRKISLKVHPDRAAEEDKEIATQKFQALSKVTKVLLDKDLRDLYDETGQVAEDDNDVSFQGDVTSWTSFFKSLYKFDIADVAKYVDDYRHSELETKELKEVYVECEGDMDLLFQKQIAAKIEDEDRFRKILDDAIESKEIPEFDAYVNESKQKRNKRKRFYEREEKESTEMQAKAGGMGESSQNALVDMIRRNQDARKKKQDAFIDSIEAKYCQPQKKKAKKTTKPSSKKTTATKRK